MNLNFIGLAAALATFLGIWFGHVAVRKVEAIAPRLWVPIVVTLILGLSFEYWSLVTDHRLPATVTGILGVMLLWNSFELWRQQIRIKKGHAPANPNNPRHARILVDFSSATIFDLLNRDPLGRPVSAEEVIKLITGNRT